MNAWRGGPGRALRAWAARRHGTDRLPIAVDRRRIYILPTGSGMAFAALTLAMLLAGLNYANNLGLGFAFLIASLGLVAMHHCHRNLLGLRVDAPAEADGFEGSRSIIPVALANDSGVDRHDLEVRVGDGTAVVGVAARTAGTAAVAVTGTRRGILRIDQFELRTRFPFGWFRAWTYVQAPLTIHVAPRPAGRRALPSTSAAADRAASRELAGDADFAGLRAYTPGVALKHMAWKTLARGGEPAVRTYAGDAGAPEWLDFALLAGLPAEERLSQLCLWVLECEAAGRRYGLRLPAQDLAPALGPAHRIRCLRALAAAGFA